MEKNKLITLIQFAYQEGAHPKRLSKEEAESLLDVFNDIDAYNGFEIKHP